VSTNAGLAGLVRQASGASELKRAMQDVEMWQSKCKQEKQVGAVPILWAAMDGAVAHCFSTYDSCCTFDAQRADNVEALRASLAQEVERKERALAQETAARTKAEQSLSSLEKSKAVRPLALDCGRPRMAAAATLTGSTQAPLAFWLATRQVIDLELAELQRKLAAGQRERATVEERVRELEVRAATPIVSARREVFRCMLTP